MHQRRGKMSNETLARGLMRAANLIALEEPGSHKVQAFREAAQRVRASHRALAQLVGEEGVEGLHRIGIGYLMAGRIEDWILTGEFPLLRKLEDRHTAVAELSRVPGIGPRLARELQALGITNLEELRKAAQDGRLAHAFGFGRRRVALVNAVLQQMRMQRRFSRRKPYQFELKMGPTG